MKHTQKNLPPSGLSKISNVFRILIILLLAPVIIYYLWTRGIVYFNYSSEVYTFYFWTRAPWLLVHVICGVVATLIGPFQFMPMVRKKRPLLHRTLGKVYIGCIVISTLVSFYLVSTTQFGIVYNTGLTMLGLVWLGCTMMGFVAIRKRNLQMHKEWMIKSYVLTLSFVGFRFVEDMLAKIDIGTFVDRKVLMAWACWAIPFVVTEITLQLRRLFSKNPVSLI